MGKFFKIKDVRLSYRLELPTGKDIKNVPLLVMIHGWNSNKDRKSYTSVSKVAFKRGYAVLSMDLRGHGHSEGNIDDCGVANSSQDVVKLIKYVIAENDILDETNVVILGGSFGGEIAIKILLYEDILITKLILVSPGLGKGLTKNQNNVARKYYYDNIRGFIGVGYNDFISKIKQITTDMFIIHGDKDSKVPISQSRELVDLNPKHIKLDIIKGMDHKPKDEKEFLKRLSAIVKYL